MWKEKHLNIQYTLITSLDVCFLSHLFLTVLVLAMNSDKFNDSFFVHSKIPSTVRLFSVFFDKEEKK